MMGPLIKRQYRQGGFLLSPELHRNLIWRFSAIGNLKPRTAPFKQLKPVGAHTDAQGHGHIAAAHYASSRNSLHFHLPRRFCDLAESVPAEWPISMRELRASILMVYVANEWGDTMPRTCVLCVDNQAAANALI